MWLSCVYSRVFFVRTLQKEIYIMKLIWKENEEEIVEKKEQQHQTHRWPN